LLILIIKALKGELEKKLFGACPLDPLLPENIFIKYFLVWGTRVESLHSITPGTEENSYLSVNTSVDY